jgi:hypothetical protein
MSFQILIAVESVTQRYFHVVESNARRRSAEPYAVETAPNPPWMQRRTSADFMFRLSKEEKKSDHKP